MATLNNAQDVENFSIADQSTAPYAWMAENVDLKDIAKMGVAEYVEAHVKQQIASINLSDDSDAVVYALWLTTGELEAACAYLTRAIIEDLLNRVETVEQEITRCKAIIRELI